MSDTADRFAFETFPRGTLAMHLSRRKFWSALTNELLVYASQGEGRKAYKLADLGNWSDQQLAEIIPVIVTGCEISVKEGFVWGKPPGSRSVYQLFPLGSPAVSVFNRINGQICLDENAQNLVQETNWDATRAFAYVRGVFLWLVLAGVCIPKGGG